LGWNDWLLMPVSALLEEAIAGHIRQLQKGVSVRSLYFPWQDILSRK
jgi:hypothetical protein